MPEDLESNIEGDKASENVTIIEESRTSTPLCHRSNNLRQGSCTKQQQRLVARLHELLQSNQEVDKHDFCSVELASKLSVNRSFLFAAVKAVTGKTLHEYINAIRITKARHLLETSDDDTIDIIIEKCCFTSKSTFYRLFGELNNMPPAEYRKNFIH